MTLFERVFEYLKLMDKVIHTVENEIFYPIQCRIPIVLILEIFRENGQNIIVINEYKVKAKVLGIHYNTMH